VVVIHNAFETEVANWVAKLISEITVRIQRWQSRFSKNLTPASGKHHFTAPSVVEAF